MRLYRVSFVAGFAAGFVAGARAGRERYDQIVQFAKATKDNPQFQQAAGALQAQASGLLSTASHKVAETVPQLAHNAMHTVEEHMPGLRHRNGEGSGNGKAAADGRTGAGNERPFAGTGTSNSHLRPSSRLRAPRHRSRRAAPPADPPSA
ncbi:MAG TPA: hypothetical protein VEL03_16225 [Streptosporangiaceae bacterium]|nr:hypothetical protein [Streptosporangiaceae bacterium]